MRSNRPYVQIDPDVLERARQMAKPILRKRMRTRIKNTSYQALNLVIQNGSGNQIRLLGDAPNTP